MLRTEIVTIEAGTFQLVRTTANNALSLEVYDLRARGYRGIPRYVGTLLAHPACWELLYEYDARTYGWSGVPPL